MLVNIATNKPKEGDVITLKLVSGDEVLGKLLIDDTDHIKVSKPVILVQNPAQPNSVMAVPFIGTAEKDYDVEFAKSHVVATTKTNSHFTKQYLEITTGIKMAKGGIPPLVANEKGI